MKGIGKSFAEQMKDPSSYLNCSKCGVKIDATWNEETSPEVIDGYVYCGIQNGYGNGCKYKVKQKAYEQHLKTCIGAFNELPNQKLTCNGSTYELVSNIEKELKVRAKNSK